MSDVPTTSASNTNAANNYFFGWDLLYKTIEKTVNKKADVLIVLAHFVLIRHSNFRCIGLGEDKTISEDEDGSELLPDGWNDDEERYALRYMHDKKLYLLLGHRTESVLIINLLDVRSKKVSNIGIDPEEHVKATKGTIAHIFANSSLLVDRYRKELMEPVFGGVAREVTTQTTTTQERRDPLRISDPMRPTGQYVPPGYTPRPFGFPDVGRGDLDPLGRGGPGNLLPFPPTRPDYQNFSPVQPRFDPYGPPEFNLRPNPNPDHFQPPNFGGDNYYM